MIRAARIFNCRHQLPLVLMSAMLAAILAACSHPKPVALVSGANETIIHGFDVTHTKYVGDVDRADLTKALSLIKDLPLIDKKVVSVNRTVFKGRKLLIVYTDSWMIEMDQAKDGNWKIVRYGMYSI